MMSQLAKDLWAGSGCFSMTHANLQQTLQPAIVPVLVALALVAC